MRKKMMSVDMAAAAGIQVKSDDGVFLVPASGGNGRPPFEVSFGSESSCCSCTCVSFQRTRLLCKHFCTVFESVPGWTFDKISPMYANNPILLLDEEVLAREVHPGGLDAAVIPDSVVAPAVLAAGLPDVDRVKSNLATGKTCVPSKYQLRTERLSARRLLKKLFNLTYTIADASALNAMRRQLEDIHSGLASVPTVDGPVASATLRAPSSVATKRKLAGRLADKAVGQKKEKFSECQLEISVMDGTESGSASVSTTYVTLMTSDPPIRCGR